MIINLASYLFFLALILVVAGFFLFRRGVTAQRVAALIVLAVALVGVNLGLQREKTALDSFNDVESALHSGKPTLVEFYSDY